MVMRVEAAIQKALIRWVKETYPEVMITATQNENSYQQREQIGSVGITDLILFQRRGDILYSLFLELKKKQGKLLPSQKEWNSEFDTSYVSKNATRYVAYGFVEAQNKIAEWVVELLREIERARIN